MALHILIMAGGSGVRFWPRSRARRPKQFLDITSERSLLEETVLRIQPLGPEQVMVVTNALQAEGSAKLLERLGEPVGTELDAASGLRVVAEPVGCNTAPAIALGAALIARHDPDAVMCVLPADHHIGLPEAFREVLSAAADAAGDGALVTVGIAPTRPETGYGYIEMGEALPGSPGVHAVRRFREKPDRVTAERFLSQGGFLWNSGMFVWRVDAIMGALERHMPELFALAEPLVAAQAAELPARVARMYAEAPAESIDYGVMEKHDEVLVLPADVGWSDVGSWTSLQELLPADAAGNRVSGDAYVVDAHNCLVQAGARTVAVVGVEGLAVVETDDAVLVCPLDRAQDVRRIVDLLREQGRDELL